MDVLSIANGQLWHTPNGSAATQLQSQFAKELIEREAQSRRNTGWKHAEREGGSGGMLSGSQLWGRGGGGGDLAPPRYLYACAGTDPQTIYYTLSVARSVGLFRYHIAEQREERLFHRNRVPVLGMAYDPRAQRIILAHGNDDGTAQLDVYDDQGNHKGAITGGDCVDAAPAMIPSLASTLIYQSCGVARHPQTGQVVAMGHSTINRLNYATGQLDAILDDPAYDFVAPKAGVDGTLYAIRRPVEKPVQEQAGGAIKDTLMLPFRLGKAVFGYLNFFSMIYGKEPLRSAGGPRTPELDQDLGKLWLHGRMVELSKIKLDAQYNGSLVPASWELVALPPGGQGLQVLASHVVSFDVTADGTVVYTNGYDVTALRGGTPHKVGRQELVEGVAVV
jgi:hypothetical protein